MAQMEEELGEALPYWDWTEDGKVPDLWQNIQAPIKQGEKSECGESQFVIRERRVQIDSENLASATAFQDGGKMCRSKSETAIAYLARRSVVSSDLPLRALNALWSVIKQWRLSGRCYACQVQGRRGVGRQIGCLLTVYDSAAWLRYLN